MTRMANSRRKYYVILGTLKRFLKVRFLGQQSLRRIDFRARPDLTAWKTYPLFARAASAQLQPFLSPSLQSGKENPGEKKMLREAFLLVKLFLPEPKAKGRKGLGPPLVKSFLFLIAPLVYWCRMLTMRLLQMVSWVSGGHWDSCWRIQLVPSLMS